nr:immunoglobulin light chain junction region [Macaca mulatta]
CQQGNSVPLTF